MCAPLFIRHLAFLLISFVYCGASVRGDPRVAELIGVCAITRSVRQSSLNYQDCVLRIGGCSDPRWPIWHCGISNGLFYWFVQARLHGQSVLSIRVIFTDFCQEYAMRSHMLWWFWCSYIFIFFRSVATEIWIGTMCLVDHLKIQLV